MAITPQEALQRCIESREIFPDEMEQLMRMIMSGEMSQMMTAAILTGLRVKKETIGEITAAARVMREFANGVEIDGGPHFLDIVGTGGDGSHTFNISTASMFVAAAGGATVAKHGKSQRVVKFGQCRRAGSARRQHHAQRGSDSHQHSEDRPGFHVRAQSSSGDEKCCAGSQGNGGANHLQHPGAADQPGRRAESVTRCFPPGSGRYSRARARAAWRENAPLVVWGMDGMDEISLGATTMVGELRDGKVREYQIHPEDFGLAMQSHRQVVVENAEQSRQMLLDALSGENATARDIVVLNAGAALYVCGRAESIADGIEQARSLIESGAASAKLEQYIKFSASLA